MVSNLLCVTGISGLHSQPEFLLVLEETDSKTPVSSIAYSVLEACLVSANPSVTEAFLIRLCGSVMQMQKVSTVSLYS